MMILFSASEGKCAGGMGEFVLDGSLLSGKASAPLLEAYEKVLQSGTDTARKALTGWGAKEKIAALPTTLPGAPVLPALERYTGVGFQYLDAAGLTASAREYLDAHLIIFSQLFGPLRASDRIPETKLKQRARFAGKSLASYFGEETAAAVEAYIAGRPVLDLRAGAYEGYYMPSKRVTCSFTKEGKTVSHWSKAYRGVVARHVAIEQPDSVEAFIELAIPGLVQTAVEQREDGVHVAYRVES